MGKSIDFIAILQRIGQGESSFFIPKETSIASFFTCGRFGRH
jgi:hypothetical protein